MKRVMLTITRRPAFSTADVDVAIIRVAHEPVAPSFKFPIQFVQDEVRQQRAKAGRLAASPPGWPRRARASSTPAVRNARISRSTRLSAIRFATSAISRSWLTRSKNFSRSMSTTPPIALVDVGLRLGHGLMGGASRAEAVAVLAERRVPQRLKPLQDRLLDQAVKHGGNAEVAPSASRFRVFAPVAPAGAGSVPAAVVPRSRTSVPRAPRAVRSTVMPSMPGGALVAHHGTQGSLYVVWGTDRSPSEVGGHRRAFGSGCRRGHFDLLPAPSRRLHRGRSSGRPVRQLVWRSRSRS